MIDEEISIIPDHISAELLFMSYLIENGLTEHRIKFLREHLFRWVPEYCDEIQRHANSAFYKEVANILKEFILSDYELMSE
jgi:TorA maturation chaperone TorD